MHYNDPYTELYHYGIPGMKWGVRKAIYQVRGTKRRRPFRMKSSFNGRFTPLDPSDGTKDWGSHIRSNAREMYRQGRRAVGNAYDKARSAAENAYDKARSAAGNAYEGVKRAAGSAYDKAKDTYEKASSAVNAGFKSVGLERYQSAILIGGGIALAGAATAGGIALYKHHKKKQAEKNKNKN